MIAIIHEKPNPCLYVFCDHPKLRKKKKKLKKKNWDLVGGGGGGYLVPST